MRLNFGKNLRRLRLGASLTQEQLSQKIGVSVQSVSRWESSTAPSFPDIELLVIIARFFGVTVDALIGCGEAGPSALEWEKLSTIEDSEGKCGYLSEILRSYPHNHDICHEICELFIISLYERYYDLPDGTVLTYRTSLLDKINVKVDNYVTNVEGFERKCRMKKTFYTPEAFGITGYDYSNSEALIPNAIDVYLTLKERIITKGLEKMQDCIKRIEGILFVD